MKRSIVFSVFLTAFLLLAACSPKIPEPLKEQAPENTPTPAVEPVKPVESIEPASEPAPKPQPTPAAPLAPPPAVITTPAAPAPAAVPSVRTITLSAQRFQFGPAAIRMKANEKLIIKINNIDFTHGVTIPTLGIYETDEMVLEGVNPGTYEFRCANYCGEGHGGMKGTLIVE